MNTCRLWSPILLVLATGCGPATSEAPPADRVQRAEQGAPRERAADSRPAKTAPDAPLAAERRETAAEAAPAAKAAPAGAEPGGTAETAAEQPAKASRVDPQIAALLTELLDDDPARRDAASDQLERLAASQRESVAAAMLAPEARVRQAAAFFFLDRYHAGDTRVIEGYLRQLADPDPAVRKIALVAANRFPAAILEAAAPQLLARLRDPSEAEANRAAAARLLADLPAAAESLQAGLAAAAREDPARSVRTACVQAVSRGAPPERAAEVLGQVLADDPDPAVRRLAAVRLSKLGEPAAARLAAGLEDADDEVRVQAARSLVSLGPSAVPSLCGQLRHPDAQVRLLAVSVLGSLGSAAAPAAEFVQPLLQDPDPAIQEAARRALARWERP